MVELLVVSAIIATFSVVLILNFRASPKSETAREQTASLVLSNIRRVQSMALAGTRYQGNLTCGFGVHYLNSTAYFIYGKTMPISGLCSSVTTRNYQAGDIIVETIILSNSNMQFRSSFNDIFFEPPDPKTFINNNSALTAPHATLTIQLKGQASCAQGSCTDIEVHTSGQINLID